MSASAPQTDPVVADHMTSLPYSVGQDQPLRAAEKRMHDLKIRHLPVLHGGALVGIVSERDIAMVESLPGVDPEAITVEEAMSTEVYTVPPDAKLAQVARHMAQHKLGAALVVAGDKLQGVFTTTDALDALAARLSDS